jgi:hypothetical protein
VVTTRFASESKLVVVAWYFVMQKKHPWEMFLGTVVGLKGFIVARVGVSIFAASFTSSRIAVELLILRSHHIRYRVVKLGKLW